MAKKKILKVFLIIIGIIVLLLGIDIASVKIINKPIFAVKEDCDCIDQIYHGLFYDTYNCHEHKKAYIKSKGSDFSCQNSIIIGKIIDIKDNYIIINGVSDNNYLKTDQEAHVSLTNNPTISGSNNLIIGQYIKVIPDTINEIYPVMISTKIINVIAKSQTLK